MRCKIKAKDGGNLVIGCRADNLDKMKKKHPGLEIIRDAPKVLLL